LIATKLPAEERTAALTLQTFEVFQIECHYNLRTTAADFSVETSIHSRFNELKAVPKTTKTGSKVHTLPATITIVEKPPVNYDLLAKKRKYFTEAFQNNEYEAYASDEEETIAVTCSKSKISSFIFQLF
jgi:hypothetical protein